MKNSIKDSEEYIIQQIDRAIYDLVYEKTNIKRTYDYYNGVLDKDRFKYLEDNYGLGNSVDIEFIPLVKKHIDVLVGEYLGIPINPKVSCKDKRTLSNIMRDKQLFIASEIKKRLVGFMHNYVLATLNNDGKPEDKNVEEEIKILQKDLEKNFISQYEIAAQNLMIYFSQNRNVDLKNKLKELFTDLLITGTMYYRIKPSKSKTNVDLQVLNPLNTFIDKNPRARYLKDSYRSVVRHYMSKQEIFEEFGDRLTDEAIEKLEGMTNSTNEVGSFKYVKVSEIDETPRGEGLLAGLEVTPMPSYSYNTCNSNLYPVYEVEYLETIREDGVFKTYRYEGVKIADSIYIPIGRSENVVRSMDNPNGCSLSVNGIFFLDKNAQPYSLINATISLQDKYNILHFYRDTLIGSAGTIGDWLDIAVLPEFLGVELPDRIMKWIAYKKAGVALLDSSQEGRGFNNNTTFSGFDDTLKAQTIQAIELAIERVENTCSAITGVFRERLNGIEQRDAVTNVAVGIKQSTMVTKQYFFSMDLIQSEVMMEFLNLAKLVYKDGLTGTIILGENLSKIFTALPEHYTVTDFDIHISDSTEALKDLETIKAVTTEFIKAGNLDPEIIVDSLTAKSLGQLKESVREGLKVKKEENNTLQQMQQQLQQAQQQLQQVQQELQSTQGKLQSINSEKLELDKMKMNSDISLKNRQLDIEEEYKKGMLKFEEKRIDLEGVQLSDGNKLNDEIKNY